MKEDFVKFVTSMVTIEEIRKQFPILGEQVYGKQLIYLDNAATSQRPLSVLKKLEELSLHKNSNIHRAVHKLSSISTEEYETTRDYVQSFIGAESREEVIFTSGATSALNLVAYCVGEAFIRPGDEILVSEFEHHSNIVPWQLMAKRKGARIIPLPIDDYGHLDMPYLEEVLKRGKARILCVAHISNVLGLVNPLKDIVDLCHSYNCLVCVDGAQGIVHKKVNVKELGCDFYAFSGHKLYASTGTGVLYIKKELTSILPPYMGGGEMIESVSFSETKFAGSPQKFEAGTQNFNSIPTFKPALDFVDSVRVPEVEQEEKQIIGYLTDALSGLSGIKVFGKGDDFYEKAPIFSFIVDGVHHEDLALIMDKMGVALRSGKMCADPLMERFSVSGMLRASFAPYNTLGEAELFVENLHKAVKMLK